MTERQKDTAFLRRILLFDDTDERRCLEGRIVQAQRDERCIHRGVWLLVVVAALSAAGFAYGALFQDNFPDGEPRFVLEIIYGLGLAALISIVAFSVHLMTCRSKSERLREECRRLVIRVLESRLGKPRLNRRGETRVASNDRKAVQSSVEVNGSPGDIAPSGNGSSTV